MDLVWVVLTFVSFLGNACLISMPFFFIHWFENRMKMWKLIFLSGLIYLSTFVLSVFALMKIAPFMPTSNESFYVSLMLTSLFLFQMIPFCIGYLWYKKRKKNTQLRGVLNT